jgi:hypothetical protein
VDERDKRDSDLLQRERLRQLEEALKKILEIADSPATQRPYYRLAQVGNIAAKALNL